MANREWQLWPDASSDKLNLFRVALVNLLDFVFGLRTLAGRVSSRFRELLDEAAGEVKKYSLPWHRRLFRLEPCLDRKARNLANLFSEVTVESHVTFDRLYEVFCAKYKRELEKRGEQPNPHIPVFSWSPYPVTVYSEVDCDDPVVGELLYPEFMVPDVSDDGNFNCHDFKARCGLDSALSAEVLLAEIPELREWEVELILEFDGLFRAWRNEIKRIDHLIVELHELSQGLCFSSIDSLRQRSWQRQIHGRGV